MEEESDEILMIRYKEGDMEAFNKIYERHSGKIYGFLKKRVSNRQEVDEIAQIIFLRLHKYREKYNDSFPFLPWIFTISKNVISDYFSKENKRASKTRYIEDEGIEIPDREDVSKEEGFNLEEIITEKNAGLEKLNPKQIKGIELRYGEEQSFEKIAEALDTTPVNARKIISRGIKKLRELMGKEE